MKHYDYFKPAEPTKYAGIQFRSKFEATMAAGFDELGWTWEYEPGLMNGWDPDFTLGENRVLVEVKPFKLQLIAEEWENRDREVSFIDDTIRKVKKAVPAGLVLAQPFGTFFGFAIDGDNVSRVHLAARDDKPGAFLWSKPAGCILTKDPDPQWKAPPWKSADIWRAAIERRDRRARAAKRDRKQVTLYLSPDVREGLKKYAFDNECEMSEAAERAIRYLLNL